MKINENVYLYMRRKERINKMRYFGIYFQSQICFRTKKALSLLQFEGSEK